MNLHIDSVLNVKTTANSSPLLNELMLNIARDEYQDCARHGQQLCQVINNVFELDKVTKKFNSQESLNVLKSLVGNQVQQYSMEGFIKEAWDKLVEWLKSLWQKFKNLCSRIWNYITGLFTKKKATSSAALAFAKAHPEAAKAIDTSSNKPAQGGTKTHDTPGQIAAICNAAPNVPVSPKAKESVKIPAPNALERYWQGVSQNIDKVLGVVANTFKSIKDAKAHVEANSTNAFTEKLAQQGGESKIDSALKALSAEQPLIDMCVSAKENFRKIFTYNVPQKLGDIGKAIDGYQKVLTSAHQTTERIDKSFAEIIAYTEALKTQLANQDLNNPKTADKFANQALAASSKLSNVVQSISSGVVKFVSWIKDINEDLRSKESIILAIQEQYVNEL